MHALIIEGEFLTAALIEDELRDLGYTSFDLVDEEEEAIRAAEHRCPDLITADQKLTNGTGVRAVLKICERRPIPVVFITQRPTEIRTIVPEAIIVSKPFGGVMLREAVGAAIVKAQDGWPTNADILLSSSPPSMT